MSGVGRGAIALGVALAAALACGDARGSRGRVLLVGIDGASPRVIEPMLRDGELPHLARIAEQGLYTTLRSSAPYLSPRVWNTIATGKTPEKHGIHSFAHEDEDGRKQLYLSSDRKVHALWNIASDAGLRVGVVNWWNTYPVPRLDGIVVSDHATPAEIDRRRAITGAEREPSAPLVHPVGWQERLLELHAAGAELTSFEDPFPGNEALPAWVRRDLLSEVFAWDARTLRTALAVEEEARPDVLMVFLPGIDRVSHWLWGNIEPPEIYPERLRPGPEAREAGREALLTYYRYTDALIGLLAERFGPRDLVMVVSDHGFEGGTGLVVMTGVHETEAAADGVLLARGPGVRPARDSRTVTVRDVTPTILAWLGLPVARDMDGRPAPFLDVEPVEPIESYDRGPIERLRETPSGAEAEILERLRRLGYFEGEDAE